MCAPKREDDSGKVRFGVMEEGTEEAGVQLPKFGVFLDPDFELIPVPVDKTPFGRFTAGLAFTKRDARDILGSPDLAALTTEAERAELYRQIEVSSLPKRVRSSLTRAFEDFEQPRWGRPSTEDCFHVYLQGKFLVPADHPERAFVRSLDDAILLLGDLLSARQVTLADSKRLRDELRTDDRFRRLFHTDQPVAQATSLRFRGR